MNQAAQAIAMYKIGNTGTSETPRSEKRKNEVVYNTLNTAQSSFGDKLRRIKDVSSQVKDTARKGLRGVKQGAENLADYAVHQGENFDRRGEIAERREMIDETATRQKEAIDNESRAANTILDLRNDVNERFNLRGLNINNSSDIQTYLNGNEITGDAKARLKPFLQQFTAAEANLIAAQGEKEAASNSSTLALENLTPKSGSVRKVLQGLKTPLVTSSPLVSPNNTNQEAPALESNPEQPSVTNYPDIETSVVSPAQKETLDTPDETMDTQAPDSTLVNEITPTIEAPVKSNDKAEVPPEMQQSFGELIQSYQSLMERQSANNTEIIKVLKALALKNSKPDEKSNVISGNSGQSRSKPSSYKLGSEFQERFREY